MQVNFNSPQAFIRECLAIKKNGELADDLVRIEIETEGTHGKKYTLIAGFVDSFQTLYQFHQSCGMTPAAHGQESGEDVANRLKRSLAEPLEADGVEIREGTFIGG